MPTTQSRINDFVLKIATVNGTGSASANGLIMKALFRMGIPVTGKNLFPSNIQGLPTWYEVRANRDRYMSRSGRVDIMVAMNAQTYQKDLAEVSPGGFLVCEEHLVTTAEVIGPSNPAFRVRPGELREVASGLQIRFMQEGIIEEPDGRPAALARLVAERP